MSSLIVEVVEIQNILIHPNADKLDLAIIKGWQCVVQRDQFKKGDKAIYFPIDSILPQEVEVKLFGANSKIKLTNGRIKTIKLRGAISQGLLASLSEFGLEKEKIGTDLAEKLGVKKYEPPAKGSPQQTRGQRTKKQVNPNFRKYTDIENFKHYNKLFEPTDIVLATEKIHGTNFRAGWCKSEANTIFKKILKLFKILPEWEFVFGSHNVQLQNKTIFYKGFYDENVYAKAVKQYNLKEELKHGEVIYGEIYGWGIQKGYNYECKEGEHKLVVFDVRVDDVYISHTGIKEFCIQRRLKMPPVVYCGPFIHEEVEKCVKGSSILAPSQKVREGIVVRTITEQSCFIGRKILKWVSDDYLLNVETEFH